jgi:hypothetical protein
MTLIEHHPVWEELRGKVVQDARTAMGAALFDDVRPAWEGRIYTTMAADPLAALALGYQMALRFGMMTALFDDVRPDWERFLARDEASVAS